MRFILTIDTEADNQWDHGRDLTTQNIRYLPRFQTLCENYDIKPTYLVTSEICADPMAQEMLTHFSNKSKAEIGAHLHAWSTPPFKENGGYTRNDKYHPFANELSEELVSEKIDMLADQIEASFQKRPKSFRSGRYGFNKNIAEILVKKGFIVDSSVTPYIDWSGHKGLPGGTGGPDFLNLTPDPFEYKFDVGTLLEIPITILPTKFPLNVSEKIAKYYFRNAKSNQALKILKRTFFKHQPLWLRPNLWMNQDLFNEIIREAQRRNLPFLVMMFHSSELMPGCSIYWQTENDIEELYNSLENLFSVINSKKIKSLTLIQAAKEPEYENLFLG